MRLLIPTSDGINISPDFDMATSFRSLSVINGSVEDDKLISIKGSSEDAAGLLENILSGASSSELNYCIGQGGELVVIAREISKPSETSLNSHNFKVFHSGETNIVNAISRYIRDFTINESEYCCCP